MKSLLKTMIPMLLLSLFLNGCQEKIKYIKSPCPQMVLFHRDKNVSIFDKKLKLEVPAVPDSLIKKLLEDDDVRYNFLKEGVWGFARLDTLKDISYLVQDLKKRGKDDVGVIEDYEGMIGEYNEMVKVR